jgi:hypothetical protein
MSIRASRESGVEDMRDVERELERRVEGGSWESQCIASGLWTAAPLLNQRTVVETSHAKGVMVGVLDRPLVRSTMGLPKFT